MSYNIDKTIDECGERVVDDRSIFCKYLLPVQSHIGVYNFC